MPNQHFITPPPALVQQWINEEDGLTAGHIAARAAQWGADQIVGLPSWLTTNEAAKFLNVSASNMWELKRAGVLKPGEHYYTTGLGVSGPKMWDVLAVRKTLLEETARRENLQR